MVDQEDMMGQYPWVVYVIFAEMFTRIIPSFLLVILNTKMIKRFHEVIEKRCIMRAKNFMEGSSKLNLTFTEKTRRIKDDDDDHVSYELGVGVTVISSRGTSEEKVAMSEDGGERRPSEQGRLVCKLSLLSQLFPPRNLAQTTIHETQGARYSAVQERGAREESWKLFIY